MLVHGPHLEEVFAEQHRPHQSDLHALKQAADRNARALPLHQLTATAAGQLQCVRDFLRARTPAAPGAAALTETRDYQ
ncbi:hypothetical protein [Streptomyces longisporoflavus]|uniref:Uncharacterized protein n=1 Tax=Streptomyces longisporoflavus TaxID=28044 RepID=A0ABW7R4Z6_9ACTN